MAKKRDTRYRNWAFIMYPDSAPKDWKKAFEAAHLDMMVSPLHDADVNADATQKKAHWHVIVCYSSVKTQEQVLPLTEFVNATKPVPVNSLRSYARYLCHLDNPEKHQYKPSEVLTLGAIDYTEIIQSAADIDVAITQMEEWCDDNGVFSYAQLCRYARKEHPEWTRLLRTRCTLHMKAYLQACQWEVDRGISYGGVSDDLEKAPDTPENKTAGQDVDNA